MRYDQGPQELKPWGVTRRLLEAGGVQVERIKFTKGGYTSIHEHHHKYNLFFITSGAIAVRTFSVKSLRNESPKLLGEVTLGPGCAPFIIAPRVPHQFVVLADGEGLEVYVAGEPGIDLPEDILRYTQNGNSILDNSGG